MKRSELSTHIKEMIVDVLQEATIETSPEEDAEPSAKDIEKDDSVSTISRKLQTTTKEMKSIVNKWKKSEGEEKERLLVRLKDLTKIKKELEGLI